MKKLEHYILPENINRLYTEEASSAIGLCRDLAAKYNEMVDAFNSFNQTDLAWKQGQEGTIRKAILYMKDNLVNTLHDLLRIYDNDAIKNAMLETYGKELQHLQVILTPQMFGAVGDGVTNDTLAIQTAINSLREGETLYFPRGTYLMVGEPVTINTPNVTFAGDGLIVCNYGFRPLASNFRAEGLRMESPAYSNNSRAFMIDTTSAASPYLENFTFKDCSFKNFFYSVCAIGGSYTFDGTEETTGYKIRDLVIENCYSSTWTNQNAGHFQCIQVENISYINNRTYGGQNASSYNAIKGNGFIRVIGNYDHNNSYASCEIENGSGNAVIANNTFNAKIWVDDSFDVVVNGNVTQEGILVSVGSDNGDSENVIITGNACRNIRCEQYGTYVGGVINNVNIHGNNVKGTNTHGIWIHGNAVKKARVANNFISGTNTNDIAIQRNEQLDCYIQGNYGNGKTFLIAGSGGKVYAVDNYNLTVSGNRDPLPASHLERSYNGLRVSDTQGDEWRINVSTSGEISAIKY